MDKDVNDIREGMEIDFKMIEEEKKELEDRVKELEAKLKDDSRIDEDLLNKKIAEATAKLKKENAKLKNQLDRINQGLDNDTVVEDAKKYMNRFSKKWRKILLQWLLILQVLTILIWML